ncbi:MAG TPA: alpha/beta hydrolase [Acidimicrobiales bacterium]|nr:alpha/beta hydrolase [Acidimicrobiales bacterium]
MVDSHVMTLSDGRDLGWLELGDPSGWPVLGFHGTPGSRHQLALDDGPPSATGVRFVLVDRPGYGLSSFQPDRRLVDWPSDVAQLADHLGIDRFSVLGLSGGGPHAAVCAALLGDRVASAALVSGVAPMLDLGAAEGMMRTNRAIARLARRRSRILLVLSALQVAAARRWPGLAMDLLAKQLPSADVAILERPEVRALFMDELRRAPRTAARAQAQDFELFAAPWGFELSAIAIPVHLWQGDVDRNVPESHARLQHEAIPGSVLHPCPGEGHFLVLDRLGEILAAITP